MGRPGLLMVGCASDNNGGEQYRYTAGCQGDQQHPGDGMIPVDLVARAEKWFGDHGLNIENSQRGSGSDDRQRGKAGRRAGVAGLGTMGSKVALGNP